MEGGAPPELPAVDALPAPQMPQPQDDTSAAPAAVMEGDPNPLSAPPVPPAPPADGLPQMDPVPTAPDTSTGSADKPSDSDTDTAPPPPPPPPPVPQQNLTGQPLINQGAHHSNFMKGGKGKGMHMGGKMGGMGMVGSAMGGKGMGMSGMNVGGNMGTMGMKGNKGFFKGGMKGPGPTLSDVLGRGAGGLQGALAGLIHAQPNAPATNALASLLSGAGAVPGVGGAGVPPVGGMPVGAAGTPGGGAAPPQSTANNPYGISLENPPIELFQEPAGLEGLFSGLPLLRVEDFKEAQEKQREWKVKKHQHLTRKKAVEEQYLDRQVSRSKEEEFDSDRRRDHRDRDRDRRDRDRSRDRDRDRRRSTHDDYDDRTPRKKKKKKRKRSSSFSRSPTTSPHRSRRRREKSRERRRDKDRSRDRKRKASPENPKEVVW